MTNAVFCLSDDWSDLRIVQREANYLAGIYGQDLRVFYEEDPIKMLSHVPAFVAIFATDARSDLFIEAAIAAGIHTAVWSPSELTKSGAVTTFTPGGAMTREDRIRKEAVTVAATAATVSAASKRAAKKTTKAAKKTTTKAKTTAKKGATKTRKGVVKVAESALRAGYTVPEAQYEVATWMRIGRDELEDDLSMAKADEQVAEQRYWMMLRDWDEPYTADQINQMTDAYHLMQDAKRRIAQITHGLEVFDRAVNHILEHGWADLDDVLGLYAREIAAQRRDRLDELSKEVIQTECGPMRRGYIPPECMPAGVDLNWPPPDGGPGHLYAHEEEPSYERNR